MILGGSWAVLSGSWRFLAGSWAVLVAPELVLRRYWAALGPHLGGPEPKPRFSLNTFRYKGLLNCAGEHRGELCWESADFRAERPRPLLLFIIYYFFFAEMALQRKEPLNQR